MEKLLLPVELNVIDTDGAQNAIGPSKDINGSSIMQTAVLGAAQLASHVVSGQ